MGGRCHFFRQWTIIQWAPRKARMARSSVPSFPTYLPTFLRRPLLHSDMTAKTRRGRVPTIVRLDIVLCASRGGNPPFFAFLFFFAMISSIGRKQIEEEDGRQCG